MPPRGPSWRGARTWCSTPGTPIHARNGIENVDDLAGLSLLGRVGEGAEAAEAIVHLATAGFTTGVVYPLDGGHVAGHHFG